MKPIFSFMKHDVLLIYFHYVLSHKLQKCQTYTFCACAFLCYIIIRNFYNTFVMTKVLKRPSNEIKNFLTCFTCKFEVLDLKFGSLTRQRTTTCTFFGVVLHFSVHSHFCGVVNQLIKILYG